MASRGTPVSQKDLSQLNLQDLASLYNGPDPIPEIGVTTLMIRNLPRSYTAKELINELDAAGVSKESYDFMYLPWDARRDCNISYAFINFKEDFLAQRCFFSMSGRSWLFALSDKALRMSAAHVQGIRRNLAHYFASMGSKDTSANGPIVWKDGAKVGVRLAERLFVSAEDVQEARLQQQESRQSLLQTVTKVKPGKVRNTASQDLVQSNGPQEPRRQMDKQCVDMAHEIEEFRDAFKAFCEFMALRRASATKCADAPAAPRALDGDRSLEFWRQLRDACTEFASGDVPIPSLPTIQSPGGAPGLSEPAKPYDQIMTMGMPEPTFGVPLHQLPDASSMGRCAGNQVTALTRSTPTINSKVAQALLCSQETTQDGALHVPTLRGFSGAGADEMRKFLAMQAVQTPVRKQNVRFSPDVVLDYPGPPVVSNFFVATL